MKTLMNGIWSGVMATGPMTLALFQLQDRADSADKSPLPPAQLTHQTLDQTALTRPLVNGRHENMTMLAHFGYGVACATLYAVASPKVKANALAKGAAFGFGVWALSYYALLPAMGLRARGSKLSDTRNLQMIFAHVVWGLALGRSEHALRERGPQMLSTTQRRRWF